MKARNVNGSLIDAYVAGYHQDKFSTYRVNNIFPTTKSYGVVLGRKISKKALHDKFTEYLEKKKAVVTKFIENNTNPLKVRSMYLILSVLIWNVTISMLRSMHKQKVFY